MVLLQGCVQREGVGALGFPLYNIIYMCSIMYTMYGLIPTPSQLSSISASNTEKLEGLGDEQGYTVVYCTHDGTSNVLHIIIDRWGITAVQTHLE